jgi:hypothetical protein
MSKPDLTLIAGGKSTPVDVIDELFEPLLTSLSRKQRAKHLGAAALLASEIVTLDKAALLALVAKNPDLWGSFVEELVGAKEYANQVAGLIENAEMRLNVVLEGFGKASPRRDA